MLVEILKGDLNMMRRFCLSVLGHPPDMQGLEWGVPPTLVPTEGEGQRTKEEPREENTWATHVKEVTASGTGARWSPSGDKFLVLKLYLFWDWIGGRLSLCKNSFWRPQANWEAGGKHGLQWGNTTLYHKSLKMGWNKTKGNWRWWMTQRRKICWGEVIRFGATLIKYHQSLKSLWRAPALYQITGEDIPGVLESLISTWSGKVPALDGCAMVSFQDFPWQADTLHPSQRRGEAGDQCALRARGMACQKKKKNPRLLEASLVPFLLPHGSLSFHLDPLNLVPFFLASMRPQDCHTPNPFQNILSEPSSEPLHCKSHWNPTAAPKAAYSQQFTQPCGVQGTSTSPGPLAI